MRDEPEPIILRAAGKTRLTCALCRARFEVPFRHRFELDGARPKLERYGALDRVTDDELSFHRNRACPDCGAAPAKAIGANRDIYDICVGSSGICIATFFVVVAIIIPRSGDRANQMLLALMLTAFLQLLAHAAVAYLCGIRASNRAMRENETLPITMLEPSERKFRWPSRMVGAVLLVVAIAAPAAPLALLYAERDVVNAGEAPALVGPGSRATVKMEPEYTSPQGVWWGTVEAKVENAETLGLNRREIGATVPANTGRRLSIADDERTFHPEVVIDIPDNPSLIGRTLDLDIRVKPTVPVQDRFDFVGQPQPEIRERHSIRISSKDDALLYWRLLRGGLFVSLGCTICAAGWYWLCNRRLRWAPAPVVTIADSDRDGA